MIADLEQQRIYKVKQLPAILCIGMGRKRERGMMDMSIGACKL